MVLWILLLLAGCGAFLGLIVFALPRIFLKNCYGIDEPYDRGLRKYRFEDDGNGILYEPSLGVRKYVKQYVLTNRYGEKRIKCKIDPKLKYLDYDIVLFNNQDKVFLILNVKDIIEEQGYAKEVVLPDETSYVSILLNQADNWLFPRHKGIRIAPFHMLCFSLSAIGLFVCAAFCVKLCFANLFGGLFRESFMLVEQSNLITAALSAAVGALGVLVAVIVLIFKYKKK